MVEIQGYAHVHVINQNCQNVMSHVMSTIYHVSSQHKQQAPGAVM